MLQEWLAFARALASQAGEMIRQARDNDGFERDYKGGHELVTSTDLAVDKFLVTAISRAYPNHVIFSEESSPATLLEPESDQVVWVIDPIDGTVNFAQGLEHVAVSIGVYQGGQRRVGVVEAPFLHKQYWAAKGQGAFCNGRRLAVARGKSLRNAVVATGFPYVREDLDELLGYVREILTHCQDIRRNGSAALDLCGVAEGILDGYYESVKPWDMAAGALIATEAGAVVGAFGKQRAEWPQELNGDHILVATADLYQSILEILQKCKK
jgi:myo-inositol-1(or 4)-monophosphatase